MQLDAHGDESRSAPALSIRLLFSTIAVHSI
jgi:hypothetical protein